MRSGRKVPRPWAQPGRDGLHLQSAASSATHPSTPKPTLAPATGAGRRRFVMLFLIPSSTAMQSRANQHVRSHGVRRRLDTTSSVCPGRQVHVREGVCVCVCVREGERQNRVRERKCAACLLQAPPPPMGQGGGRLGSHTRGCPLFSSKLTTLPLLYSR